MFLIFKKILCQVFIYFVQINLTDNEGLTAIHLLCDGADRGGAVRLLVLNMMLDTGLIYNFLFYWFKLNLKFKTNCLQIRDSLSC